MTLTTRSRSECVRRPAGCGRHTRHKSSPVKGLAPILVSPKLALFGAIAPGSSWVGRPRPTPSGGKLALFGAMGPVGGKLALFVPRVLWPIRSAPRHRRSAPLRAIGFVPQVWLPGNADLPIGIAVRIGFVLPRPIGCSINHNPFPAKHLPFFLPRRELALFVQHPTACAPAPPGTLGLFGAFALCSSRRRPVPQIPQVAPVWLRFA
jgi:hypothetical protein